MKYSEAKKIWGQIKTQLGQNSDIDPARMNAFFASLIPQILSETEFILSTSSSVAQNWVERSYLPYIKEALFDITGRDYKVRVVISDNDSSSFKPIKDHHLIDTSSPIVDEVFSQDKYNHAFRNPTFKPFPTTKKKVEKPYSETNQETRTFDSFVVADSNKLAYSAAMAVAENPGELYNPLFIYGKSGLGKTHLLLAIKDYVNHNHPYMKVAYTQTSDFIEDYTTAIREKDWGDFAYKYRSNDMLLLDDVQNLEGKEQISNEVFNIFNRLTQQRKHVILSADRAPRDIDLDERFASRFASGITTDIQPPSFETKLAIFKNYIDYSRKKFNKEDIHIPEDVYTRIIELSSSNIRELEGAATSLIAYMTLERQNPYQALTVDEAERTVEKVFLRSNVKKIDIITIQRETEKYFSISHADLIGSQRSQNITYPRQVAMYLSRTLTGESYPDIAKAFGGKNHTSVMYAVNNIESKRQENKDIFSEIERLVDILQN